MELTVNVMKFDTPNKSGRIYPKFVMEEAIKQFNENKNKFGTFGEIGPTQASSFVELSKISHKVKDMWIDEDNLKCNIETLNTPNGNTLNALLESGAKLAIAPRMQVDIQEEKDEEGNTILNEDGKPKTYIKSANIISIDVIPNEYRTFEDNTIKIGET